MKFRVRIYEENFHGKKVTLGKQLKQKTFEVEDWDRADEIAHRLLNETEEKTGLPATMSLSIVK